MGTGVLPGSSAGTGITEIVELTNLFRVRRAHRKEPADSAKHEYREIAN
jgi:hypothetical protein